MAKDKGTPPGTRLAAAKDKAAASLAPAPVAQVVKKAAKKTDHGKALKAAMAGVAARADAADLLAEQRHAESQASLAKLMALMGEGRAGSPAKPSSGKGRKAKPSSAAGSRQQLEQEEERRRLAEEEELEEEDSEGSEEEQEEEEEVVVAEPVPKKRKRKATPLQPSTLERTSTAESLRLAKQNSLRDTVQDTSRAFRDSVSNVQDNMPSQLATDRYDREEDYTSLFPGSRLQATQRGRKMLSGSVRTADCRVPLREEVWPQEEGIYVGVDAEAPGYDELSIEQFVQGFLSAALLGDPADLACKVAHCVDLMDDAQVRDWESVRAFHKVWMHSLEQKRVNWAGSEAAKLKMKLRHIVMAPEPPKTRASAHPNLSSATSGRSAGVKGGSDKKPTRKRKAGTGVTKLAEGMMPCKAFNDPRGCPKPRSHGNFKHCCSSCYKAPVSKVFDHSVNECWSVVGRPGKSNLGN